MIAVLEAALTVARALEALGVPYLVGGSMASSFHGEPRTTQDVDMVVGLKPKDIEAFVAQLGDNFYAEVSALGRAVEHRSSANLIHLPSSTKIDLFIMGGTPVDAKQMARRQRLALPEIDGAHLYVYAPEDILLQKLRWYRLGDGVSERQWRDVLALIRVQHGRLDLDYARETAAELGVEDLLESALDESSKNR